jgi:hypothetical protein
MRLYVIQWISAASPLFSSHALCFRAPGIAYGAKFAEARMAQIAESSLAGERLVMTEFEHSTLQTKLRDCVVTTRAEGP